MADIKMPILGNAKEYISPHENDRGRPRKDTRPTFEVARTRLMQSIDKVNNTIKQVSDEFKLEEFIINARMHIDYSSKSYHPDALIGISMFEEVGTKKWSKTEVKKNNKQKTKIGKEIFLRVTEDKLKEFQNLVSQEEGDLPKGLVEDIRSIEEIFVDRHDTIINHFQAEWSKGRVELVIHPYGRGSGDVLQKLLTLIEKYGGDASKVKTREYPSGLIFVSALLDRHTLEAVINFNPIRTAHPLVFKGLPEMRGDLTTFPLPQPPVENVKSSIVVGVFDGGVNSEIPHIKSYVTEHNPIGTDKDNSYISHGVGVVGAALYGNLVEYSGSVLPTPPVSVESFRVFPPSDPHDYDLYEVIDIIEDIAPKRPDIKIYNLSLGPYGAIEDDNISRFTYAIDLLSRDNKRWFSVAVGNDGDLPDESLRRIQAPADAVNNLGVGSFTYDNKGKIVRAPYSCIGDGREGCKVKPDIVAFGGCDRNPFHLIGIDGAHKMFAQGTSFSSPLVASKAAEIIGRCNFADPLLARALLVHTAKHPQNKPDKYLGNGILNTDLDEVLGCKRNEVTVVFQSNLQPARSARLDLPFINGLEYEGKTEILWTLAIATNINAKNTEDYTLACIEDRLYPNINMYSFSKIVNGKPKLINRHLINDAVEIVQLELDGWKRSKNPAPYSATSNKYKTEQQRRTNFQWDTITRRRYGTNSYRNIENPYLFLHAMDRYSKYGESDVYYAVVVTIKYIGFEGDAYDMTLRNYDKLQVANIRSLNEIFVKV